jgi:plasmid stabilization system protein ParE
MTPPTDPAEPNRSRLGRRAFFHLAASAALSLSVFADTRAALSQNAAAPGSAPSWKDLLGSTPGEARKLVAWKDVIRVFRELERVSGGRMTVEALGTATEGAPYIAATFTSPANRAQRDELRRTQDTLADPRKMGSGEEADLLRRGRNVVVITCGIHSTEVASTLAGMHIAHRLATGDDDVTKRILDECVVVLCPSINPDGVDIVKDWYDRTLGTPYEGSTPPRLYQKYVGHDDNRDWVAFTQAESRITVDKVLNVYKPQILHDIHQMGGSGPRMFVPPYLPPIEPNVPPEIIEGFTTLGRAMQAEMTERGKRGVVSDALFDGWTPLRAYVHYHHGIRILSETASARLATPVTVTPDARWLTAADNFPAPWPGGVWGVGEAADYMTTAAFALLRHAAENRETYLKRYLTVAKRAVRAPEAGQRAAFLIPPAPNRPALLSILRRAGVEVTLSREGFRYRDRKYPKETAIVRADQPYIAFANALLVPTRYPDLTDRNGRPVPPYDVTAHCLSLLLDVPVQEAAAPFAIPAGTPVEFAPLPEREIPPAIRPSGIAPEAQKTRVAVYQSWVPSMDEGWTRFALEQSNIAYTILHDADIQTGGAPGLRSKADTIVFADQSPRAIRSGHAPGRMPPEYTGGLGEKGAAALRAFVEEGGTAVFLNGSCSYAIETFDLPVKDIAGDARAKGLYLPGALLRLELDRKHPVAKRMPRGDTAAWVEDSPVFEPLPNAPRGAVTIAARYPTWDDILLSGWLRGGDQLAGQAALVEVRVGKGRCILFGFRPQYRGHSFVTYPLLANALARRD